MATKLLVMADKATPGTKKATSATLLMAMVETASAAVAETTTATLLMAMVETASATVAETTTATFPSAVKIATRGGGSHRTAVVGASIGEITGSAR